MLTNKHSKRLIFYFSVAMAASFLIFGFFSYFQNYSNAIAVEYPNNRADTWIDMTNSLLLLHMNNNWNDSSGLGYNGSAEGAIFTASSRLGSHAGYFDGNDYISTGLNIDQGAGKTLTICAWAKPISTLTSNQTIVSTDNGGYDWALLKRNNKWTIGKGNSFWESAYDADIDTWQHVCAVWGASSVKLYKNGEVSSTSAPAYDTSDNNVYIGRNSSGGEYFIGNIDEVAIWNRELSSEEIGLLYDFPNTTIIAPTGSDNFINPTLITNSFIGDGVHESTNWKICQTEDCSSQIVWEKNGDMVNLESIEVNSTNGDFIGDLLGEIALEHADFYYVQAQHYDSVGGLSEWSESVSFSTIQNPEYPVYMEDVSLPDDNCVDGVCIYDDLVIRSGVTVTVPTSITSIVVNGDAYIDGSLSAIGQGFAGGAGTSSGMGCVSGNPGLGIGPGGAGYGKGAGGGAGQVTIGGNGGYNSDGGAGGVAHTIDNYQIPNTAGAGGGSGGGCAWDWNKWSDVSGAGGAGGGIITMSVVGNLDLEGTITAAGDIGQSPTFSRIGAPGGGGGAGGSVYLYAGSLTGELGSFSAAGGAGGVQSGDGFGGGGGGAGGYLSVNIYSASFPERFAEGGVGIDISGGTRGGSAMTYPGVDGGGGSDYIVSIVPPNTPTIVTPDSVEIEVTRRPILVSSDYSSSYETHTVSDWEIYESASLEVGDLVWSAYDQSGNLEAISVDDSEGTFSNSLSGLDSLAPNTQYWVRVRHANNFDDSEWSPALSFTTFSSEASAYDNVTIDSNTTWSEAELVYNNCLIRNDSKLYINSTVENIICFNLTIEDGSNLSGDSKGSAGGAGTSTDSNCVTGNTGSGTGAGGAGYSRGAGGGAGHTVVGGTGAAANGTGGSAGSAYANLDYQEPITIGSGGGGAGQCSYDVNKWGDTSGAGGNGGGRIKLQIISELNVEGNISVDAEDGQSPVFSRSGAGGGGGGAGGSIYITAGEITGEAGNITAMGGLGGTQSHDSFGGGGAGSGGYISLNIYDDNIPERFQENGAGLDVTGGIGGGLAMTYPGEDSDDGSIYVISIVSPNTPTIVTPDSAETEVTRRPIFVSSAYSSSYETHSATDWEIYNNESLVEENLVWSSYDDLDNLEAISVDDSGGIFSNSLVGLDSLAISTQYWVRVRHANSFDDSEWSVALSFTTFSSEASVYDNVIIDSNTTWSEAEFVYNNCLIRNDSNLYINSTVESISCYNLTVDQGSGVSADGKGGAGGISVSISSNNSCIPGNQGIGMGAGGAGQSNMYGGGGGGHRNPGGTAGYNNDGSRSDADNDGQSYLDATLAHPRSIGSGGGSAGCCAWDWCKRGDDSGAGGAGGGKIILNVTEKLILEGFINAQGEDGQSPVMSNTGASGGGGGAGGSIDIMAGVLESQTGTISVTGGNGGDASHANFGGGGAGSGGYLALHTKEDLPARLAEEGAGISIAGGNGGTGSDYFGLDGGQGYYFKNIISGLIYNTFPTQTKDGTRYVDISYSAFDLEQDNLDLVVYEYSFDSTNGVDGNWLDMTEKDGVNSGGRNNITTSQQGVTHHFMWDIGDDLPNTEDPRVYIRLQAYDGSDYSDVVVSNFFIVDSRGPSVGSVDLISQPEAGDISIVVDGWLTESNPKTNIFQIDKNGSGYNYERAGQSDVADPSQTTVTVDKLDGNDYISGIKLKHTDRFGNFGYIENLSSSRQYVKPYQPAIPELSDPTSKTINVDVKRNLAEADNLEYAILVEYNGEDYFVQADGSFDESPVWQTETVWGTITVTGATEVSEFSTADLSYPVSDYKFQTVSRNPSDPLDQESSQSEYSQIAVLENVPPMVPTGMSPDNGETTNLNPPIISWNASVDADNVASEIKYQIRISEDSDPESNYDYQYATTYGATSYELDDELIDDTTYYYVINAIDITDLESGWSEIQEFYLDIHANSELTTLFSVGVNIGEVSQNINTLPAILKFFALPAQAASSQTYSGNTFLNGLITVLASSALTYLFVGMLLASLLMISILIKSPKRIWLFIVRGTNQVYSEIAPTDQSGTYKLSYNKFKKYHKGTKTVMLASGAALVIKIAILGLLTSLLIYTATGMFVEAYNDNNKIIEPGDNLTYRLDWQNTGESVISNFEITSYIPNSTTFVSSNNEYQLENNTITFTDASVSLEETGNVEFIVSLDSPNEYENIQNNASYSYESLAEEIETNKVTNPVSVANIGGLVLQDTKGIANATVILYLDDQFFLVENTEVDGGYVFDNLGSGEYEILVNEDTLNLPDDYELEDSISNPQVASLNMSQSLVVDSFVYTSNSAGIVNINQNTNKANLNIANYNTSNTNITNLNIADNNTNTANLNIANNNSPHTNTINLNSNTTIVVIKINDKDVTEEDIVIDSPDENLLLEGQAEPGSKVYIYLFVDGQEERFEADVDEFGYWQLTISSEKIKLDNTEVYIQTELNGVISEMIRIGKLVSSQKTYQFVLLLAVIFFLVLFVCLIVIFIRKKNTQT